MYSISRNLNYQKICYMSRLCSTRKTHYEVLDLPKTCSDRDIKQAFIRLSKKFHPDMNKNVKAQEHFVRILEAYNVLGKPLSRARYDNTQYVEYTPPETCTTYEYPKSYNDYSTYYRNQYKSHEYNQTTQNEDASFSSMNKLNRKPKYVVVLICLGLAVFGFIIQMALIKKSAFIRREYADKKSQYLQAELDKVRNSARENGNEIQTRLLIEKINSASNPTIATATLGQALANPRKS